MFLQRIIKEPSMKQRSVEILYFVIINDLQCLHRKHQCIINVASMSNRCFFNEQACFFDDNNNESSVLPMCPRLGKTIESLILARLGKIQLKKTSETFTSISHAFDYPSNIAVWAFLTLFKAKLSYSVSWYSWEKMASEVSIWNFWSFKILASKKYEIAKRSVG